MVGHTTLTSVEERNEQRGQFDGFVRPLVLAKEAQYMGNEDKMPYTEFVQGMIRKLRRPPYVGIHTVYSGFNKRFREYYGEDPQPVIEKLVEDGFLKLFPKKGGPLIILASEYAPKGRQKESNTTSPTVTVAKAKQAKAKAKAKAKHPLLGEFTTQVRVNSGSLTRRNGTIYYKLCSMIAAGEITRGEALEVLRTMERLTTSSLDRITQWVGNLEGGSDS